MTIRLPTAAAAGLLLLTLDSTPAAAYVGPGAGIGMIGAAIGLAVVLITAIGIVVQRLVRWRPGRRGRGQAVRQAEGGTETDGE